MSFELPNERVNPTRVNPKKIIIFSSPKAGKTETVSKLENNLIIDLEDGAGFVSGLIVNVWDIATKNDISPLQALRQVINKIKESNKEKGGYTYKYITIDTISALENDYAKELACILYKNTSIGKNYSGDDVIKDLSSGGGYLYLREAVILILSELEELCDTLIILGHTKDKLVEKDSKEMVAQGLDLAGKLSSIVCSQSDAIAYLYRKGNQTIANFNPAETLTVGARPTHLKNKEIVLLESDENGNFTSHWDKVFLD